MGPNENGQYVYSWLASTVINDFDEDISPLIHYLWRHKYISESTYLGIVQFGTETFYATSNVTFSTWNFNMSLTAGPPRPASASLHAPSRWAWITMTMLISLAVSF